MSPHEFLATLASAIENSHQWATSKAGPDFWLAKVYALRDGNTTDASANQDVVRTLCRTEFDGFPQMAWALGDVQQALALGRVCDWMMNAIHWGDLPTPTLIGDIYVELVKEQAHRAARANAVAPSAPNILTRRPAFAAILTAPLDSERYRKLRWYDEHDRRRSANKRQAIVAWTNYPHGNAPVARGVFKPLSLVLRIAARERAAISHEYPLLKKDWPEALATKAKWCATHSYTYGTEARSFPRLIGGNGLGCSMAVRLHDPVPSKDDPSKIAYFQTEDKSRRGIRTVISVGKYLTKYFAQSNAHAVLPVMSTSEIQILAEQWHEWYRPITVHYKENTDPEGWSWVYSNERGFTSCMSAGQYHENGPDAVRAYAYPGNGLRLAYITADNRPDGGVTARAIVRGPGEFDDEDDNGTVEPGRARVYGDQRLGYALDMAGYPPRKLQLLGVRMCAIPFKHKPDAYYTPYVDAGTQSGGGSLYLSFVYHDEDDYFITTGDKGISTGARYEEAWDYLPGRGGDYNEYDDYADDEDDADDDRFTCPECLSREHLNDAVEVVYRLSCVVDYRQLCTNCAEALAVQAIVSTVGEVGDAYAEHCVLVDGLPHPLLRDPYLFQAHGVLFDEEGDAFQNTTTTVSTVTPWCLDPIRVLAELCVALDVLPVGCDETVTHARREHAVVCPFSGKTFMPRSHVGYLADTVRGMPVYVPDTVRGMPVYIAEFTDDWMTKVHVNRSGRGLFVVVRDGDNPPCDWPTLAEHAAAWPSMFDIERDRVANNLFGEAHERFRLACAAVMTAHIESALAA